MPEGNEKIEGALNLVLQIPDVGQETESMLRYGYDEDTRLWQVIVKYIGDIKRIEDIFADTKVVELLNQYAIITTREEYLSAIAALPEIEYMEKPKRIYFNLDIGRSVSCINSVQGSVQESIGERSKQEEVILLTPTTPAQTEEFNLTGEGVLIGIVDSGIDYRHPTFRNVDGSTRIAYLWDQSADTDTAEGRIPAGYGFGVQYSSEDINSALDGSILEENLIPSMDRGSGHGTAVAGVAAGNGSGSVGNRNRGIAPASDLIVVKLGRSSEDFAGTTEVMEGIDYVMQKAIELQKPVAINLSFGNNNGAHDGRSLFENYISDLNGVWKNVVVVASGNEGDARHHAQLDLESQEETVAFAVGPRESSLTLQIWKDYVDEFSIRLESPAGEEILVVQELGNAITYNVGNTKILVYYGAPSPYTISQEIYFEWQPEGNNRFIEEGIWKLHFEPENIVNGRIDMWLPTIEAIGFATGFLVADPDTTLTIPSAAENVITVGAYRSDNDSVASFSGRGNTTDRRFMPTIVAPGVNVTTALPGGGYGAKSGTSIAAPFVTGSAALMMEWGIVRGNDPYLYGEKVKAYLMKGARRLPGQDEVPNTAAGWGALCLRNSLP